MTPADLRKLLPGMGVNTVEQGTRQRRDSHSSCMAKGCQCSQKECRLIGSLHMFFIRLQGTNSIDATYIHIRSPHYLLLFLT